jgi:transposase
LMSDHHGHDWQDPAHAQPGQKSEREIARTTGLSRNTVAKWLHGPLRDEPKYKRGAQPGKLTAFHETIKQALKADARRPRQERRTARALRAEIKAAGYAGGYSRVTDFIRAWRDGEASPCRPRPSSRWPSSLARPSSSTGAKRGW